MPRPSKLSPEQWAEVDRRLAAGEGVRALAAEFDVSPATISKRGVAKQSKQVQAVAKQMADAQQALSSLPIAQQYVALSLAEEIRGLQTDVLAATRISAKSGLRLHSMANTELLKVDDASPEASVDRLKGVAVLTKMGNEALSPALNLLAANKDRVQRLDDAPDPDAPPSSGVLVVPGLASDAAAWSAGVQKAAA